MGRDLGALKLEDAQLSQMVRLHLVLHWRRELKVGHEDEVYHRDGDGAPRLVVGHGNAPFSVGLECGAKYCDERHAGAAFVARLREDDVSETARKFSLRGLFYELVAAMLKQT